MQPARILVVDDDPRLREMVRYALAREGFDVAEAADGRAALDAYDADPSVDLIVLDVLMPELDGLDVCRELRKRSEVPIVFLSSKSEEIDRVLGLELGGDAYLAKPFSPRELVSQVKAVLRRARGGSLVPPPPADDAPLLVGRVTLDPAAFTCTVDGADVGLTVTELRLLQVLMGKPGRAFTRDELAARAYPDRRFVAGRTVDSHIRGVRSKLRDAGAGDPIETVHGLGYRLKKG